MNVALDKIPIEKGIMFSMLLIVLLAPALLFLFFFQNKIFIDLDTLKLILICAALGSPFVLIAYYFSVSIFNFISKLKKYNGPDTDTMRHGILGLIAFGLAFTWSLTFILSCLIYLIFKPEVMAFAFTIGSIEIFLIIAFSSMLRQTLKDFSEDGTFEKK